jgi:hypothetical protein
MLDKLDVTPEQKTGAYRATAPDCGQRVNDARGFAV